MKYRDSRIVPKGLRVTVPKGIYEPGSGKEMENKMQD